ncbi:glycosyltransferase family 4 protein [Actinoplanes sp. NPDC051859]|uniref:glycosyltransferase family 4 protein n=1 Tax=Actinoplanes sp. NPDC051859 TaxID=3363909 RepID=UPI0037B9FEFB
MTTVAFILVSWTPDAPAGMERATAAAAVALTQAGHRAVIISAAVTEPGLYGGVQVMPLLTLPVTLPCDDRTLRTLLERHAGWIRAELVGLYRDLAVDAAVYVDALWGLGRIAPTRSPARRILAAHVVGHDTDLHAALDRQPDAVIAPSETVRVEAAARGYPADSWRIVPNTLLVEHPPRSELVRGQLRRSGPVRVLARLSPVKGVTAEFIHTAPDLNRPIEVALAHAGFEDTTGEQHQLALQCRTAADHNPNITLRGGMSWLAVPAWLAEAALVIVPSHRESFGLVALEAMSVGTPVVGYAVDNLPHLVGDGGSLVPLSEGPAGLWRAVRDLLDDPVRYEATSRAADYRTRDYRPALCADQLLKVVS